VHIPHACAYPIAGLKHAYQPPGYPGDHPFVPHGHSVIVTAPAAFRFTYDADPERHHTSPRARRRADRRAPGPDALPDQLTRLMRDVGAPIGIAELGYTEDDVPRWSTARSSSRGCWSSPPGSRAKRTRRHPQRLHAQLVRPTP
jgi:alcohol dehydrogenase class IV